MVAAAPFPTKGFCQAGTKELWNLWKNESFGIYTNWNANKDQDFEEAENLAQTF